MCGTRRGLFRGLARAVMNGTELVYFSGTTSTCIQMWGACQTSHVIQHRFRRSNNARTDLSCSQINLLTYNTTGRRPLQESSWLVEFVWRVACHGKCRGKGHQCCCVLGPEWLRSLSLRNRCQHYTGTYLNLVSIYTFWSIWFYWITMIWDKHWTICSQISVGYCQQ